MERYFILDKFNTFYDWRLILTGKDVQPPEPKINSISIDGMNGSIDLSESLTGEVVYDDREISATFWTNEGTRKDREKLLRDIRLAIHGRKIKIIEPDDPEHYFIGRVIVKAVENNLAYAEFTIEATCEPWRYTDSETERSFTVNNTTAHIVINNDGFKTVCPTITVTGSISLIYADNQITLNSGTYKISNIKFYHGANIVAVSGNGSVTFKYTEADL